jgi:hypothetical protein
MFTTTSTEITTALVAERQATLRNEARQHRQAGQTRRSRWGRRTSAHRLAGANLNEPLL